jgi:alkanesulfonate monooxygenase SsuD/methylene tetrahydromethanopterin reductase-like flavin-dependent oxidoreductase (luciferase family)
VSAGSTGAAALRNSIDLATCAERLGFHRYWLAEHHNLPSVASSAPEIMIGQIAAATTRIRVGSGGVMLPNHAPLMVAERFKMLEALFPGRIDLGIGRAPGTDPVTSFALRHRQHESSGGDDFLERFQELILLESNAYPEGHPQRFPYTPVDRERIRHRRARLFTGTPDNVMAKLMPLIDATRADELMITTMLYDHAARRRSYELLADAFAKMPGSSAPDSR